MASQNQKRSCLYDIGWIRQKGEWLNALRQFSGCSWVDMATMDSLMRKQLQSGAAYVGADGEKGAPKEDAKTIILDTGVLSQGGGDCRKVLIKFSRNKYGLWEGIDFELGEFATEEEKKSDERAGEAADELFHDVYLKEGWNADLARQAIEEPWGNEYDVEYGMLLPYLRYTYSRLKQDNKLMENSDRTEMIFNTGLVSRLNFDPIIALCVKNDHNAPYWKWDRFICWSDDADAKSMPRRDQLLRKRFPVMPRGTEWFNVIEQTLLNPTQIDDSLESMRTIHSSLKNFIPDIMLKRMAEVGLDGSPNAEALKILKEVAKPVSHGEDLEERKRATSRVLNLLGDRAEVFEWACDMFDKAFKMAIKRLSWEVGTAVPMYSASKGRNAFSFLLPISFDENKPLGVDYAVILDSKVDENGMVRYCPKSLLELKYAYSNARLLRRPEARWLCDYMSEHVKELGASNP